MFESLYSERKKKGSKKEKKMSKFMLFFFKLENPGLHQQVAPTPTSTL